MQVDLANRQVGSDIRRPPANRLASGVSNMARGARAGLRELSSPKLKKKRQYGDRSATPKTPPNTNIGRTVLEFGEELRGEVGEVDNIDNVIDAADMSMEFGSLEEEDNNNKKKAAQIRVTEHIIKNSTNFAQGKLLDVYNELLAEYDPTKDDGDYYSSTLRRGTIEFTHWTQDITDTTDNKLTNDAHYYTNNYDELLELELKLNTKRGEVIELIEKHLPEYIDLINMGTKFSILTRILHKLHYSPEGTTPDPDDPRNHSPFSQCCVATMMTKLPNFLINEDELRKGKLSEDEIVAKMTELMSYGGKPKELNNDLHKFQAITDLIFLDLEKKKKKGEMEKQYKKWAGNKRCKLNSMWELFTIMYNIDRLHMLLHRAAHPGKTLQVHCASAATAFYGFNLEAGTDKYATKFVGTGSNGERRYVITFAGHPQTYLMGLNKSLRMFPKDIREIIAQHLIELYSVVYEFETFSRKGFTTCIMDVFGGNSKDGVDVGEYACLARLLEESGLLDLKKADIKSKSIREKMRPGPTPISTDKLIGKLREKDWDRANIERLLVQLKEASDDFDLMMRRMKQFRAGARLHYIAAQLLAVGDGSVVSRDVDSIPPHITTMIEEITKVLQQDENDTWRSLMKIQKNQKESGERLGKLGGLMSKLASIFNNAGGEEGNGLATINNNRMLDELALLFPGGKEAAINAIAKLANRCNKTFWRRYNELKKYREDFPDDVVDGILTIDMKRENGKYKDLHDWLVTQNGHLKANGFSDNNDNHWGIKAYERMGSIEQLALLRMNVTFDTALHDKAMKKRLKNNLKKKDMDKTGGKRNLFSDK